MGTGWRTPGPRWGGRGGEHQGPGGGDTRPPTAARARGPRPGPPGGGPGGRPPGPWWGGHQAPHLRARDEAPPRSPPPLTPGFGFFASFAAFGGLRTLSGPAPPSPSHPPGRGPYSAGETSRRASRAGTVTPYLSMCGGASSRRPRCTTVPPTRAPHRSGRPRRGVA
jgi:hypothetical protein